jgi:uncharacterized protein (UPF0332 family)
VTFPWDEYIRFAETIARNGASASCPEAWFRAVVSRAYYGAFWLARLRLRQPVAPPGVHDKVIKAYSQGPRPTKKVGILLLRLKRQRIDADYEGSAGISDWDAETAVRTARDIQNTLSASAP